MRKKSVLPIPGVQPSCWVPSAFAPLIIALIGLLTLASSTLDANEFSATHLDDRTIFRVYFDDIEIAHKIAISFEPLESNYERGYLVLILTADEREQLVRSGLDVKLDDELTRHYADRSRASLDGVNAIPSFPCYRTVEETFSSAQAMVNAYPALATWSDQGDSWLKTQSLGGYDMHVLKLTQSAVTGPKPIVFITSAVHAREYTTAELATRLAENLVSTYSTDPDVRWILDYHEIHFLLVSNPDGRKQAEAGILWRKNYNQNYCSAISSSYGADLNRNFPFNWDCCGGSSGFQCDTTYSWAGPHLRTRDPGRSLLHPVSLRRQPWSK